MRFLSKLFSVPELSKYSEEEYERLVWQAKLRRGDAIWVIPAGAGIMRASESRPLRPHNGPADP